MILRDQLTQYLAGLYEYSAFEDYCENGLQVEGKEKIQRIVFGVSFNMPFLQQAIEKKADAIIVHHGIFGKELFKIRGTLRQKIKLLIDHDISLYGIHLPMDAHRELGHSALLLSALGVEGIEHFDMGYRGQNVKGHSLDVMLGIFHKLLHQDDEMLPLILGTSHSTFSLSRKMGFTVLTNGPAVPRQVAVISGGGAKHYEEAIEKGVDTFFTGEIKEQVPAISLETCTNFINLGHYDSEKPGVLALQKHIADIFDIQTNFVAIANEV